MHYADLAVLVVDDSPTMTFYAKNALHNLGIKEVIETNDGKEAVMHLTTPKVDAIIADWNMPQMNGLELLKWVRANEETQNLPFLMLTAQSDPESVREALKARVTDYVVKPFAPVFLSEKL